MAVRRLERLRNGRFCGDRCPARSILPLVRANDQATADLLTQRMQVHEKTAWMLGSLLA
jgi:hypothetical protein